MSEKKKCGNCGKNRFLRFYENPRNRYCDMCKKSIKFQKKKATRKASNTYIIKKLDNIAGDKVRARGICQDTREHECKLGFQWCHGISRRYHNTRWLEENGFCLCGGSHKYYTDRPLEWEEYMISQLGQDMYDDLKEIALDYPLYKHRWQLEELLEEMI